MEVQKLLGNRVGKDVYIYSLTLDPERDSPAALKRYAENHQTGPGWLFLTGRPDDLEQLRRKLGFVDPDPELDRNRSEHAGVVLVGNEALDRWCALPGMAQPQRIVEAISWMAPIQRRSGESLPGRR